MTRPHVETGIDPNVAMAASQSFTTPRVEPGQYCAQVAHFMKGLKGGQVLDLGPIGELNFSITQTPQNPESVGLTASSPSGTYSVSLSHPTGAVTHASFTGPDGQSRGVPPWLVGKFVNSAARLVSNPA